MGIDLMGPFPKAIGGLLYIIVAIDYMTKWVKAKAFKHITAKECQKFSKDFVVMRFGFPIVLISNNGTQFIDNKFKAYLVKLKIQLRNSLVAHPQVNGQVKVTNEILLWGLEKRLDGAKRRWAEELPNVLWAYRTTHRSSTGESPFKLAYGTEAIIPVEIG